MSRINIDFDLAQWTQWLVLDMTFLALATALLWLPFPGMNKRTQMRWLLLRHTHPELRRVFGNWQNYLDLLRSAAGAFVLLAFSAHLEANPNVRPELLWVPKAGLLIGVLIQSVRLTVPITFFAPLFYLGGMTLLLPGYLEGGFAFLFGWALAIGAKDVRWQLPAMGSALLLIGFINQNLNQWLLLNALMVFTPLGIALLFNRPLTYPTREPNSSRSRGKPRKMVTSQHAPA